MVVETYKRKGYVMENMELLQAMRQMMEEVVSPIYERLDKMDERFDKMDERLDGIESHLEKVETLATKTQIALENDIKPKINLLFEGQNHPPKSLFAARSHGRNAAGIAV